ncbi:MAG: hypothetical protein JW864_05035 [Spirochaetes bacterium]|nr:hypothetical protein [Spirochaetota bacterium]
MILDNMDLRLIKIKNVAAHHVSMADVDDFESSILELSSPEICYESVYLRKLIKPSVALIINKLCLKNRAPAFCISMGASVVSRGIPHMFFSSGNILYLFDAWPETYNSIKKIIKAFNIDLLLVSSAESAEKLRDILPDIVVEYCPEGCRTGIYRAAEYKEKDIDVIQIGRKYDLWHNKVLDKFHQNSVSYIYEKVKGEVIFQNRNDFINGLGRSRISVCFPKSLTHPYQSGGVTTMTQRYLQSVASKCLILGVIPDEMKKLFGYDPGVAVDMRDPAGQIMDILYNFNDYIPLIEKNFTECINHHGWDKRWSKILEIIQNR